MSNPPQSHLALSIAHGGAVEPAALKLLRGALAQAGVLEVPPGDAASQAALLVFDRLDTGVSEALRELRAGVAQPLLALQLGAATLHPHEPWRLLAAGAADLLRGLAPEVAAASIALRLERWRQIEQRLASNAVKQHLVGDSPAWRALLRQVVELACFGERDLMVIGESGTGKELVARLLHTLDPRPDKRELVVLDCATLQPELSGSEFFGHERGAFTGAAAAREGAFALADQGTLFLDEVGELPLLMQPQLLRVIQEHSFKRLGASHWQRSRFRLVCATHRDLAAEVRQGGFRADLYYRLAACCLRMPPLRERRDDIAALALHALAELCPQARGFDPAVLHFLRGRDFPGNVRELRQLVARMAARHVGAGPISVGDIPEADRPAPDDLVPADWRSAAFDQAVGVALAQGAGLRDIANHAGDSAIRLAMSACDGNLPRAARRLGVTDRALQLRRAGRQADSPAQTLPVTPSLASLSPSR